MRILLLTDNYPPETSPPALRCSTHAKRWVKRGHHVTMVTSFPNFPHGKVFGGYRQSLYKREILDTVDVLRVPTLVFANRGIVLRVIDFLSFMVSGAIGSLFVGRPDVVIATSPQFFTAVAGWLVSCVYRRPFVFEVRDLWPDSIIAVGAMQEGLAIRTSLGVVFALAGLGKVVGGLVSGVIPDGSRFGAVLAYGLGMALFTMVMGNAFAAFPVMAAAIGIPLLIQQYHGDPAVVAAVGMLAGFCGTLMTPLAANFNIVPAARF